MSELLDLPGSRNKFIQSKSSNIWPLGKKKKKKIDSGEVSGELLEPWGKGWETCFG